jgi:hypothetical protein
MGEKKTVVLRRGFRKAKCGVERVQLRNLANFLEKLEEEGNGED